MAIRIIAIIVALAALGMVLWLIFGKGQKSWDEMSDNEQKRKKTLVTGGILVFLSSKWFGMSFCQSLTEPQEPTLSRLKQSGNLNQ
ncbi:MAG: hypothetical protein HZB98_01985 [Bacteroidia bacterium]|nr:hypothetical protein [Bacteroidia bacterium]